MSYKPSYNVQNTTKIQDWLISHIAEIMNVTPGSIDVNKSFSSYGLSSLDVVTLSGDLEAFLGCRLSPTLAYDYPSILRLSRHLANDIESNTSPPSTKAAIDTATEPIAVIGMACRFPGAKDLASFWELLRDGVDAISEIPANRWQKDTFYHSDPSVPGKAVSYWGGFLDKVDQFDPFFFGISPAEAETMDPQQRLLLELSYEALDDAGQTIDNLNGTKTGVFIGISVNEYSHLQLSDPLQLTAHSGTGTALSIAANRISYFFNFHGPSLAIDTACSSSLAAVHLACQSLKNGECTMAVAGGVNMILSPAHSIAFSKAGVLAPDGRCKTFDASANGYVRGEGGGLIVLKTLSQALLDGDPIHALISGSAISQDGRTNGLMAPSRQAQETLLHDAYRAAGISPESVQYIEAHGTGTLLGDSMEAQAIGAVMSVNRTNKPLAIGSVKTNIGHLEAAAGIAGLIKVILSLKHKTIPPNLHFSSPNPYIPFHELNIEVNNKLNSWPKTPGPAIAGVSSFGFGGTNVHVVLRDADNFKQESNDNGQQDSADSSYYPLTLSANSSEALHSLASSFLELLAPSSSIHIKDICYASNVRRSQFNKRLVVFGQSKKELYTGLQNFVGGQPGSNVLTGSKVADPTPKLAFVFSGQGGQWCGMGRELMKQEPVFLQAIERVDLAIQTHSGWSLMELLYSEQSESRLNQIDVIQPALFAIQVALAELWQHRGIKPDAVVGHSMGEVAAAHVAGILNLEDAVRIICCRSKLLKDLCGKGNMLATDLSPHQARELLKRYENGIEIAAINSPFSTVLSGNAEAVKEVMEMLQRQNLFCKLVNVDVASHTAQINVLRCGLLKALDGLHPQSSSIPFYSTVTGGTLGNELTFKADYWFDNVRKPVLFHDAIVQLLKSGHTTFIEIGPHPVLLSSIQQSVQSHNEKVRLLPSLHREEPELKVLLETLGTLYTNGFSIAWNKLYPKSGKHVSLPLIPWQRRSYWIDTKAINSKGELHWSQKSHSNFHPLLGKRIELADAPSSFMWQHVFDDEVLQLLEDHRIENEIVFPAGGYIEMALQAAKETSLNNSYKLSDFVFKEKITFRDGEVKLIQLLLAADKAETFLLSIYSRTDSENWVLNASVSFIQTQTTNDAIVFSFTPGEAMRQQCATQLNAKEFYQTLQLHGVQYGARFRCVQHVWINDREALGLIKLPEQLQDNVDLYQVHPVLLDACLQVLGALSGVSSEHNLYLPAACQYIQFFSQPGGTLWSHVSLQSGSSPGNDVIVADIKLVDDAEQIVAELIRFRLQRTRRERPPIFSRQDTWFYHLQWQTHDISNSFSINNGKKRNWLVFTNDEGLGDELARQLEAGGDYCNVLLYKEVLEEQESEHSNNSCAVIEKHLKKTPTPLYGIIHLWSLCISPSDFNSSVTTSAMAGCNSVLWLVQALAKSVAGLPRLWLVTRGAQPVQPGESVSIEQSPLWGIGKVISFELPGLKCTRIDLDPQQTNADAVPYLVKQVLIDDGEDQVAFRSGVRFVPRLLPFPLATVSTTTATSLRSDSTYMITGGLGGLGLTVAKWMVQKGVRHLVLLGRSEPSSLVISSVDRMRQDHIDVMIAMADISDRVQLDCVLDKIKRNMPVLRGIIHAAGVLDDAPLLDLNADRLNIVMAPKVDGTWNLHQATIRLPLNFFVLFSSAVSVLGSPGQGNYAAANAYLDAMAHFRRNLGLPAISINWGPWAKVGLAAEATERLKEQNASTQHLVKVITADQGLEILEYLLSELTPQVMVLPFDLKNLIELYPTAASMPFLADVGGSDSYVSRLYARPNLRQDYAAPRNEMERKLAALWQETLHIDRIGVHDSFFELGGDSVLAAQILTMTQKTFGIRINPQDAFQAFTITRLAEMLQVEILNEIEEMSEEEVQQQLLKRN